MTAPSNHAERAATHTPGPWDTEDGEVFVDADSRHIATVTFDRDFEGTVEEHRVLHARWQQQHANARLIAAAPELYEALRNIVGMIVNCPGVPSNSDSLPMMVLANARGALDKAEGRRR